MKILSLLMIAAAMASPMLAGEVAVPEIDAGSASAAVSLLLGGFLVVRTRRQKK